MTTIALPLLVDGKLIGVLGVDIALNALQASADAAQKDLFNGMAQLEILSSTGLIAAYSGEPAKVGKNLIDTLGAEGKEIVQLLGSDKPHDSRTGQHHPRGVPGQTACRRQVLGHSDQAAQGGTAGRQRQAASRTRQGPGQRHAQGLAGRGRRRHCSACCWSG